MNKLDNYKDMMRAVAKSLGSEICAEAVFVGGCTTGFFITDPITLESVRHTEDVDLIIDVLNWGDYQKLNELLRDKGFKEAADSNVICRWRLGPLTVDIMPIDSKIMGFTSAWYRSGSLKTIDIELDNEINIRILSPVYFLATKTEAFLDRGNGDFLLSQDIEDILNVVNGREELVDEVLSAEADVREFVANHFKSFLGSSVFEQAIQGAAMNEAARIPVIYERLEAIAYAK